MNKNYLEYSLTPTNLLMVSSIEFDPNDEWIEKINISSMRGHFHLNLKFELRDNATIHSQAQLKQKCNMLLAIIEDELSFSYGIKLHHPHFLGLYLNGNRQPATHQGIIIEPVTLTKPDEELLLNQICVAVQNRNSNVYKRLYRNVLQIADPIARFMLLYSLMQLALEADNQKQVDDFIRITSWYNSTLDRITTRKGANFKETIYSWLRNAVGHTQESYMIGGRSYSFEEILEEIDRFVDTLSLITRQAIETNKI
ncbi:hypothetical protein WJ0W_005450 [Paenibacillus melissococcoides]|uniref:Apea-like HEPN domain-containing protein n=1 Tax=Paenibacillus melissococcoides TaxID=2912268 RepID=A0ABN8UAM9_9BACL|nr:MULTISPECIES: hypothetical protein [Paenibacillus]MEB9895042.1 hypothetical protein [Bacillus cereus]CAH8248192.1 hypothetical protein WJ0W_005450 [Paenibacillus melissococcoides]CAH8718203.1 hypothetical protein HTL2_005196 [Paenibacillus melissococcoides]CAH8718916.1 hypothetical protein WDD9_005377 [Paenibacillus melissococcoides]GIO80001.1 hypothetical protein J6TS7_36110 [Paenibacillus dendritiformis]